MTHMEQFGPALRRERECRGIDLETIAHRTKIGAGLLAAMERGDWSRWPGGIFRRSFLRSYAEAIGLDPEQVVADYLSLSNDENDVIPAASEPPRRAGLATAPQPRLSGGAGHTPPRGVAAVRLRHRAASVALDSIAVFVVGLAGFAIGGWLTFWLIAALFAIAFHSAGVLAFGTSPSLWLFGRPLARETPAGPPAGTDLDAEAEPETPAPLPRRPHAGRAVAAVKRPPARRTHRHAARPS
jgi:transcriptional regulator with XRE-family HTH domain